MELRPKEQAEHKLREARTITPTQVNMQSTDVADEEQLFFLPVETIETEKEILRKKQARQIACGKEPTKVEMTRMETAPMPINKAACDFVAIKEDTRIRVDRTKENSHAKKIINIYCQQTRNPFASTRE